MSADDIVECPLISLGTMATDLRWKDEYSVNNELMDRQHRRLLDLAAKVLDARGDPERLLRQVDALYDHTLEHFRAEERLMREFSFPGYVNHRATHDRIMDEFHTLNAQLRLDPRATSRVEYFMVKWVLDHITSDDRRLGAFLGGNQKVGLTLSPEDC